MKHRSDFKAKQTDNNSNNNRNSVTNQSGKNC